MNTDIIKKIDELIEEYEPRVIEDTVRFVNIKSTKEEPLPGAPFGLGPRKVLDEFLNIAGNDGFYTKDLGVGFVTASMYEGEADLGIWMHGDVVEAGDGWKFPPYDATVYSGCIIGRGATDNKGQLSAILNLFRIFKDNDIKLNYNPAIFLGSNEETGMGDLVGIPGNPDAEGFLNCCKAPKLSLVPDGGFPVGYGGKGGMSFRFKSRTPFSSLSLVAGKTETPGLAVAELDGTVNFDNTDVYTVEYKDGKTILSVHTPPIHSAHPDPNGNMITRISEALLDSGALSSDDRKIIEFIKNVSLDISGKTLCINTEHEIIGNLTVCALKVDNENGCPTVTVNIRYPLGITIDEILERAGKVLAEHGFDIVYHSGTTIPYLTDPSSPIVNLLHTASSEVTGTDKKPYTLCGGTYANRLPNAFVFGTDGNLPPADFEKGRGGAHGIDEAVSVDRLKRAMRIYARALLMLNDAEW